MLCFTFRTSTICRQVLFRGIKNKEKIKFQFFISNHVLTCIFSLVYHTYVSDPSFFSVFLYTSLFLEQNLSGNEDWMCGMKASAFLANSNPFLPRALWMENVEMVVTHYPMRVGWVGRQEP